MAILRTERKEETSNGVILDGIAETAADVKALNYDPLYGSPRRVMPGSLMYCVADGKTYIRKSNWEWGT